MIYRQPTSRWIAILAFVSLATVLAACPSGGSDENAEEEVDPREEAVIELLAEREDALVAMLDRAYALHPATEESLDAFTFESVERDFDDGHADVILGDLADDASIWQVKLTISRAGEDFDWWEFLYTRNSRSSGSRDFEHEIAGQTVEVDLMTLTDLDSEEEHTVADFLLTRETPDGGHVEVDVTLVYEVE